MDQSVRIYLGCLLPTVFDLTLTCGRKCRDVTEVGRVEESVRRQLDAACEKWDRETCAKVRPDYELARVGTPVTKIKGLRVKNPSVRQLIGDRLYSRATCFMVWVPLPDCDLEVLGVKPYTRDKQDYMWIPTSEQRELDNLKEDKPREAACHELKEWVRFTMRKIRVQIPSAHREDYWSKLNDALTPENIRKLNKEVSERVAKRKASTSGGGESKRE
jgi:hypothetical protein